MPALKPGSEDSLLHLINTQVDSAAEFPEMAPSFMDVLAHFLQSLFANNDMGAPLRNKLQVETLNGMGQIVSLSTNPDTAVTHEARQEMLAKIEDVRRPLEDLRNTGAEMAAPVELALNNTLTLMQEATGTAPAAPVAATPRMEPVYQFSAETSAVLASGSEFADSMNDLLHGSDAATRTAGAEGIYDHLSQLRRDLTLSSSREDKNNQDGARYPEDLKTGIEVLAAVAKNPDVDPQTRQYAINTMKEIERSRMVQSLQEYDDQGRTRPGYEFLAEARDDLKAFIQQAEQAMRAPEAPMQVASLSTPAP
jgi:hypothetical protein